MTLKKTENKLAMLGNFSKKSLSRAKETIIQSTQTVKARIDLNSLKGEEEKLFLELGKDLFSAVKSNSLDSTVFDETIANIDDVKEKIERKKEEIRQINIVSPTKSEEIKETSAEEEVSAVTEKETCPDAGEAIPASSEETVSTSSEETSSDTTTKEERFTVTEEEVSVITEDAFPTSPEKTSSAIIEEEPFAVTEEEFFSEADEKTKGEK